MKRVKVYRVEISIKALENARCSRVIVERSRIGTFNVLFVLKILLYEFVGVDLFELGTSSFDLALLKETAHVCICVRTESILRAFV